MTLGTFFRISVSFGTIFYSPSVSREDSLRAPSLWVLVTGQIKLNCISSLTAVLCITNPGQMFDSGRHWNLERAFCHVEIVDYYTRLNVKSVRVTSMLVSSVLCLFIKDIFSILNVTQPFTHNIGVQI